MTSTNDFKVQSNDFSLKDVIYKIREWISFLWKIKLWIIGAAVIGASIGIYYSLRQKILYEANLTMVTENASGSSGGVYAGLASQFGIDLGGGNDGLFSGENILEFLVSRTLIQKALLSPVVNEQNRTTSLAELYIDTYQLREKWQKFDQTKLQFPPNADVTKFSRLQDSIMGTLYKAIRANHLQIKKGEKKITFLTITCNSQNEIFSKYFVENLVAQASDFYIKTKTLRMRQNVDNLQNKADSLEYLLNRKTYSAAAEQDLNLNPARRIATVNTELVSRDKMILQTVYAEVIKNLEVSKTAMVQQSPIIQVVDRPILPLDKYKFGKLKGILVGGFSGAFIVAIIGILIRMYRIIMR